MALTTSAVNRLLEQEPWACAQLAAFAGRAFMIRVGPVTAGFRIDARGLLDTAALSGATPDVVLTLSPLDMPAFLADPRRWNEFVTEDGDAELSGALKELAQTLPWFVERLAARALGPIVGQRVADAGRSILRLPEYAATRVAANVGSYARDEAQVLAHPADMRALVDDTARIAARVDSLDTRVEALATRAIGENASPTPT